MKNICSPICHGIFPLLLFVQILKEEVVSSRQEHDFLMYGKQRSKNTVLAKKSDNHLNIYLFHCPKCVPPQEIKRNLFEVQEGNLYSTALAF